MTRILWASAGIFLLVFVSCSENAIEPKDSLPKITDKNLLFCDEEQEGVVIATVDESNYRTCRDGEWVSVSPDEVNASDVVVGISSDSYVYATSSEKVSEQEPASSSSQKAVEPEQKSSSSQKVVEPEQKSSSSQKAVEPEQKSSSSQQVVEPEHKDSSSSQKVVEPELKSSSSVAEATVNGDLEQTLQSNDKMEKIEFSGVESEPKRNSWNVYWLKTHYDKNKKTFVIESEKNWSANVGAFSDVFVINGVEYTISVNVIEKVVEQKSSSSIVSSSSVESSASVIELLSSSNVVEQISSSSEVEIVSSSSEVVQVLFKCEDGTFVVDEDNCPKPASSESVVSSSEVVVSSSATIPGSSFVEIVSSSSAISSSSLEASSSSLKVPVTYTGELEQTVVQNAKIEQVVFSNVTSIPSRTTWNAYYLNLYYDSDAQTYTITGTVPDHVGAGEIKENFLIDGETYTLTLKVVAKSSSSVALSSSSIASSSSVKSSSSVVSSSSVASSSAVTQSSASGSTPEFKVIGDPTPKNGYATRYWDSCKPHCSWSGNSNPLAKTCHADGSLAGQDETSVCDAGGTAGTCLSQIPMVINDNLAYAFAATPGGGNDCGKCYMLTFNGTGKYVTNGRTQSLSGKKLVVISSNIGYDVAGGQFDIMIPGGGVGAFDGCSRMGLSCAGAQYGGLLSSCEDQGGSDEAIKQCLISSCEREYANNAQAQAGCLFLANWMGAAGNPNHTYVQVECPSELLQKF